MSGRKRTCRANDVPVPRPGVLPFTVRRAQRPGEVPPPTAIEVFRSEVAAIVRSADPALYDLLDHARRPLPTIAAAERILTVAARDGRMDESRDEALIAGAAHLHITAKCADCRKVIRLERPPPWMRPQPRAYCQPCGVSELRRVGMVASAGALTAAGPPSSLRGLWFERSQWPTAVEDAAVSPPKGLDGPRRHGTGRRSSRPTSTAGGK